jgi:ubiquinone/menaquinone biosynthesis C-methylase UbiE
VESKHDTTRNAPPQTTESLPWVSETVFGKWFVSLNMWRRFVVQEAIWCLERLSEQANLRPSPGGVVLDVGCGGGAALELLAQAFRPREIIGIDIDAILVDEARQKSVGSSACINVHEGTIYALSAEAESVDVVFCHQLLHHLTHQSRALAEIYRVLKPGGLLMVSESCDSFLQRWWVRTFFRHPSIEQKSAHEYRQLLTCEHFEVVDEAVDLAAPWWSDRYFNLLGPADSITSDNAAEFTAIARKPFSI